MVERTSDIRVLTSELVKRLNDNVRRIRLLEMNLERAETDKSSLEESLSLRAEELNKYLTSLKENVKNLIERVTELEAGLQIVHQELDRKATSNELKELENFISLISPANTTFVTKEELEKILEEKFGKKV